MQASFAEVSAREFSARQLLQKSRRIRGCTQRSVPRDSRVRSDGVGQSAWVSRFVMRREGRRRFRAVVCAARNMILEAERVSALRNFFMSLRADSFSLFVFETVQSRGTNNLKSRIYASFAVKSTQKLPAIPVRIKLSVFR